MKSQYETLLICPWIFEEIEVMRNPLRGYGQQADEAEKVQSTDATFTMAGR